MPDHPHPRRTAILTVGLGFGDEGKGAAVDHLCRTRGADLVVRYSGGSQCGHNVELPDGRRHTFAQFGAGTLAGVPTFLGDQVIMNPGAMKREADHLEGLGVRSPFETLSVHPEALVSTAFPQILNALREAARGSSRHGSCGHGIGETRAYWLEHGADAIKARDLHDRGTLLAKLELLRQRSLVEAQALARDVPDAMKGQVDLLGLELSTREVAAPLIEVGERLRLEPAPPRFRTAVFEGAQGVLLDEYRGFHPHTTWSTVTLHHAIAMARAAGADRVETVGVTRSFTTRHGDGPLPTYDEELTARLLDPGNPWNRHQGSLRVGWLDLPLLRYAVECAGDRLDSLSVSWLDGLGRIGDRRPRVCVAYEDGPALARAPFPDLAGQEALGRRLLGATPVYREVREDELVGLLADLVGVPVGVVARGPTFEDREILR